MGIKFSNLWKNEGPSVVVHWKAGSEGRARVMLGYFVGGFVFGAIVGSLLGRRWGIRIGLLFLVLGIGPLAALFVYENMLGGQGDTSSLGLFSMICLLLFAPFGLVVLVFGALRGE